MIALQNISCAIEKLSCRNDKLGELKKKNWIMCRRLHIFFLSLV